MGTPSSRYSRLSEDYTGIMDSEVSPRRNNSEVKSPGGSRKRNRPLHLKDIPMLELTAFSCAIFGRCQELAAARSVGPASFGDELVDMLYQFDLVQMTNNLRLVRHISVDELLSDAESTKEFELGDSMSFQDVPPSFVDPADDLGPSDIIAAQDPGAWDPSMDPYSSPSASKTAEISDSRSSPRQPDSSAEQASVGPDATQQQEVRRQSSVQEIREGSVMGLIHPDISHFIRSHFYESMYDWSSENDAHLVLKRDDRLSLLNMHSHDKGWWEMVNAEGIIGLVAHNYLQLTFEGGVLSEEDGTIPLPTGAFSVDDATIIFPDGATLKDTDIELADGGVTSMDELRERAQRIRGLLCPDGSILCSNGAVQYPSGATTTSEGSLRTDTNEIIEPAWEIPLSALPRTSTEDSLTANFERALERADMEAIRQSSTFYDVSSMPSNANSRRPSEALESSSAERHHSVVLQQDFLVPVRESISKEAGYLSDSVSVASVVSAAHSLHSAHTVFSVDTELYSPYLTPSSSNAPSPTSSSRSTVYSFELHTDADALQEVEMAPPPPPVYETDGESLMSTRSISLVEHVDAPPATPYFFDDHDSGPESVMSSAASSQSLALTALELERLSTNLSKEAEVSRNFAYRSSSERYSLDDPQAPPFNPGESQPSSAASSEWGRAAPPPAPAFQADRIVYSPVSESEDKSAGGGARSRLSTRQSADPNSEDFGEGVHIASSSESSSRRLSDVSFNPSEELNDPGRNFANPPSAPAFFDSDDDDPHSVDDEAPVKPPPFIEDFEEDMSDTSSLNTSPQPQSFSPEIKTKNAIGKHAPRPAPLPPSSSSGSSGSHPRRSSNQAGNRYYTLQIPRRKSQHSATSSMSSNISSDDEDGYRKPATPKRESPRVPYKPTPAQKSLTLPTSFNRPEFKPGYASSHNSSPLSSDLSDGP